MQPHDVGDMNVERLVGASYKPELPDPDFVKGLHAQMQTAAQTLAASRAPARPDPERLQRLRRRLGWAMAAAAAVAGVALVLHAANRPERPAANRLVEKAERLKLPADARGAKWAGKASDGLTPRPRAAVPEPVKVAVGTDLVTKPGERRRAALADGSVLYVNSDTHARYTGERQVQLLRGEVYVEVAPREPGADGATFRVKTTDREVAALGTRFGVVAEAGYSSVVVTQGKVQVSGLA